ncbi:MAG: hypothetical protein WCJ06_10660 [Planctomycetota bacterium]
MTSIPIQSKLQLGFMKIAFAITLILTVFSSLSVWVMLNSHFTKEFKETYEKSQEVLVEPTKTNIALQKEIHETQDKIGVKVEAFKNFKMDGTDTKFEEAKQKRKNKDAEEKFVSIEMKDLPENPVFKLSELAPLLAFKNVKSILEKQIKKDFSQGKLKGNSLTLNDVLVNFVNERKKELAQSEKYKMEFGKKWVAELKDQKKADKENVIIQLKITEKPRDKDGKFNGFTELKGDLTGLETLLEKPNSEKINLFFAFDYFSPILFSVIKASNFDKDPNKEMATIEEKRKHLLKLYEEYKAFVELLKKDNK